MRGISYADCTMKRNLAPPMTVDPGTRPVSSSATMRVCLGMLLVNMSLYHGLKLVEFLVKQLQFAESVGKNFRVLPMFEKELYAYKYKKHYSLNSNEFLQCRWRSYVQHFDKRQFEPFSFISVRDYHFYNQEVRLIPSETVHRHTDFRFKLREGPGVDWRGQMPIPQELLMKRGYKKSEMKPEKHAEAKVEEKIQEKVKID